MNSFANTLFSLLFGWARSLIQQIWNAAAAGKYSGFLTWLGDHWLYLAAVLALGCTVMDFLIWLIRWQPYLVWRTKLRRLVRFFRRDGADNQRRFEQGYQGGVGLDIPQEAEEAPPQEDWEGDEEAWKMPETAQTFTRMVMAQSVPERQGEEAPQPHPAPSEGRPRQFPAPAYEAPPLYISSRKTPLYGTDSAPRRRRSDKYGKRRPEWQEKLIGAAEDEDTLLDGLPPAVDRQEAFHEPVYPRKAPGAYPDWQRPGGNHQMDGQE